VVPLAPRRPAPSEKDADNQKYTFHQSHWFVGTDFFAVARATDLRLVYLTWKIAWCWLWPSNRYPNAGLSTCNRCVSL